MGLVTVRVPGEPASCSELGGALRSHAARLLATVQTAQDALAGLQREPWAGPLADSARRDLRLVETIIDRLDEAGGVLQRYAQELAGAGEAARQLASSAAALGLELDGLSVVEPWGVASADAAARRRDARPELQMRSDRIASQLGRARAALQRSMAQGRATLASIAQAGRDSLGT